MHMFFFWWVVGGGWWGDSGAVGQWANKKTIV